jgi:CHAT domain-containing protein
MVGSRQSAAIRTRSSDQDPWWGTKDALDIQRSAQRARQTGDLAAAERIYQYGLNLARRRHVTGAMIRYLAAIGSCRLLDFQYRGALDALMEARGMAQSSGDAFDYAAISFNLSSLYLQAWDLDSALRAAAAGLAKSSQVTPGLPFRHQLLLQLGRLHEVRGDREGPGLLTQSIEASREVSDPMTEAMGWDFLGEHYLAQHLLADAERALDESFRIRVLRYPADLAFSLARLGELKLAQGDLTSAARLTDLAIAARARGKSRFPDYILIHQRGQIKLARGDSRAALQDFAAAVDLVTDWRKEVPPAISTLTAANVELERHVFDSFIETAASEALRRNDSRLSLESLQALTLNRAASLRESMALSRSWRKGLPTAYWDILGQLRAEQARMIRGNVMNDVKSDSLRLKLTEFEAKAGLTFHTNQYENFRTQTSLTLFRRGLGNSELFLSFHLGEKESYRWAVTRTSVHLHRLPGVGELRGEVARFRDAVEHGRAGADRLGEQLYATLLDGLNREETGKYAWLLSLEDTLFEAPIAALVVERKGGKVKYLVEEHSLQIVPGALRLSRETRNPAGNGWFLGVGDAIYNRADPRARPTRYQAWLAQAEGIAQARPSLRAGTGTADRFGQLNRLVASGTEVETSARSFHGPAVVLTGDQARRGQFVDLISHGELTSQGTFLPGAHVFRQTPSIIHLATHVLTPAGQRGQAVIAFGLDPAGDAELLTSDEIAMLRVPGAVVAMTGCESAAGEVKPGAGVLGLTRAWLTAGASAVVATTWPVRDTNGNLFISFYSRLRAAGNAGSPAEALAQSQREMIRSGTWRASPVYWASYQVTGGAR